MLSTVMLFLGMYLLFMAVGTFATDLKQIQRRIEKERQVEKIKNQIRKNILDNGARISRPGSIAPHIKDTSDDVGMRNTDVDLTTRAPPTRVDVAIRPPPRKKQMIGIGETVPEGLKKEGCLRFQMKKSNSDVTSISPIKINLWIHVRKKKGRKNKHSVGERISRHNRVKRSRRRGRTERRSGRKIKIFVSNDENKRLAKLRMRVTKSGWQNIELPISQFPKNIVLDDTFTLCLVCKRCNKRTRLDLYKKNKKKQRTSKKPIIPFLLIEGRPILPLNYRHKRSHESQFINNHNYRSSCCHIETYEQNMAEWFPDIYSPNRVNISYCVSSCDNLFSYTTSLSHPGILAPETRDTSRGKSRDSSTDQFSSRRQCIPQHYKSFSFVFTDRSNDGQLKFRSIPNLMPTSCHWSHVDRKLH